MHGAVDVGLDTLFAHDGAKVVVKLARLVGSISGTKGAQDEEERDAESSEDHELTGSRACLAEFSPGPRAASEIFLELVGAKLVVDEATKGNAVTESLE